MIPTQVLSGPNKMKTSVTFGEDTFNTGCLDCSIPAFRCDWHLLQLYFLIKSEDPDASHVHKASVRMNRSCELLSIDVMITTCYWKNWERACSLPTARVLSESDNGNRLPLQTLTYKSNTCVSDFD